MAPDPNNLRDSFIYYTECQLATVETLKDRKRTSQSELRRQESIAKGMIAVCSRILISGNELKNLKCSRVYDALYKK